MGGIEFKRDGRTGEFLMIEPTVGRIDAQEEVATLHDANIPLAATFTKSVCRDSASERRREPTMHH